MFSTIDRPHARFLRVFLITGDGELPVEVPTSLNEAAEKLHTQPSEARAAALVKQLAEEDWAEIHYLWQQRAARVANYDAEELIGYQVFKGDQPVQRRPLQRPPGIPLDIRPVMDPPDAARVPIKAVRLEVGRIRYDKPKRHLYSEILLEATHRLEDETS